MNDVLKTVFEANLPTLLIVASIGFLFIGVAGSVAGKIDPGPAGRIGAGVAGAVLLAIGISLKVLAPDPTGPSSLEATPAARVVQASPPAIEPHGAPSRVELEARVAVERQRLEEPPARRDEETPVPASPVVEAVNLDPPGELEQERLLQDARERIAAARVPGARFFGVLFADDGNGRVPLAGARVELRAPGASAATYSTRSESDGVYAFPRVAPGTYEIAVRRGDGVSLTVIAPPKPVTVPQRASARRMSITVRR